MIAAVKDSFDILLIESAWWRRLSEANSVHDLIQMEPKGEAAFIAFLGDERAQKNKNGI